MFLEAAQFGRTVPHCPTRFNPGRAADTEQMFEAAASFPRGQVDFAAETKQPNKLETKYELLTKEK